MVKTKIIEKKKEKQEERLTVKMIREKFPNPVDVGQVSKKEIEENSNEKYCVGGALGLYFGILNKPFPWIKSLSYFLMKANPHLTVPIAESYAKQIIMENDHKKNFEAAWKILDNALSFGYARR